MTMERFAQLVEAYGADIARWPEAERAAGHAWVGADSAARALFEQAVLLDRALHAAPVAPASRALFDRIVAGAPQQVRRGRVMRWAAALGLGAALATAAVSGVAVGAVFAPAAVQQFDSADPLSEASTLLDPSDAGSQAG